MCSNNLLRFAPICFGPPCSPCSGAGAGGGVAEVISRRLRRIVRFAEQVAAGDLSARIAETSGDEIAQVAMALDRTARRLEENFAAVKESRSELEALLNSMTDGVIAVSPD